jgi:hypothetical protein
VIVLDRPRPELELATENELRRYDSRSQIVEFAPGEKKPLKLVLASAED